MKLTETDIESNWNKLLEVIEKYFSGDRKEKILKLHTHFDEVMPLAPASSKDHFHNAFPGGYVIHILNVINAALLLKDTWKTAGCTIDFTDEELVFAALFHDLGKVGDLDMEYYIPQEDQWRRSKLHELYTLNPQLDYMDVSDRAVFLLMHFNIACSNKEFLALRLADGLYNEANKKYYISYGTDTALKTNLPFIIHGADFMAMTSERDLWKRTLNEDELGIKSSTVEVKKEKSQYTRKQTSAEVVKASMKPTDFDNMFEDVFGSATTKGNT